MKTSPNGNFTNGANITDIFTGSVSSSSPGSASTVRSMKTSSQRPFEETSSKISSVNKTTLTPTLSQMTRSTEPISRNVTERGSSIRSSVTKPLTSDTEDYNSSSLSSTKNPQADTSMFTVETDGDSLNFTSVSNATTKLDEADVLLSREDASGNASAKKFTGLVCKFLQSVEVAATTVNMTVVGCDFIAQVAIEMAKSSSKQDPFVDRMQNYSAKPFSSIAFFTPMISEMKLIDGVIARATKVVVKNPMQLKKLEFLLTSEPCALTVFSLLLSVLSQITRVPVFGIPLDRVPLPFPGRGTAFLGHGRILPDGPQSPRPSAQVAPAYVLAEEVRSSFLDEFSHLEPVDSWTKHIISQKIEDVRILSLFPARYAANSLVTALVRKVCIISVSDILQNSSRKKNRNVKKQRPIRQLIMRHAMR
ncbi:hypothetical protein V5799_008754 [Amblyomma americanum]|uniref:Uncharacterized protein n=1 Tax=Amblyomma americanum TaxID=6943 RepID=A0AAQ4FDR7_AMBAM